MLPSLGNCGAGSARPEVTKIVVLAPNLSPRLRVKGALQSASSRRLAQFDHSDVCGRVEAKEARRWIEVEFDVRKRDLGHIAEYEKASRRNWAFEVAISIRRWFFRSGVPKFRNPARSLLRPVGIERPRRTDIPRSREASGPRERPGRRSTRSLRR